MIYAQGSLMILENLFSTHHASEGLVAFLKSLPEPIVGAPSFH